MDAGPTGSAPTITRNEEKTVNVETPVKPPHATDALWLMRFAGSTNCGLLRLSEFMVGEAAQLVGGC
jgi:hypothetical protein